MDDRLMIIAAVFPVKFRWSFQPWNSADLEKKIAIFAVQMALEAVEEKMTLTIVVTSPQGLSLQTT